MRNIGNLVRAAAFLAAGMFSLSLMIFFAFFAMKFLLEGAGLQVSRFSVTPGGVLIGVVPFVGLLAASGLCFLVGITLCAYGVARFQEPDEPV